MKKGISVWAFSEPDLKKNMKRAAELGFDGIELALDESGTVSPETTPEQAAELVAYAKELGLEFYSMATGLYWDYSITSDDAAEREKAKQIIKDHLRVASYFGCETILVVPGAVKVNFIEGRAPVDYSTAYDRAFETIKELVPVAEQYNVRMALENVGNMFLLSPVETRDFIDKIGSPYVTAYCDVGNVLCLGCPEHWIRGVGKRIDKVHFKDYFMVNDVYEVETDLLRGSVDYTAIMPALREIGYDGWVTAEVFPYKVGNDIMLQHTALAMDYIVNEL